jgi:hypothetical protein
MGYVMGFVTGFVMGFLVRAAAEACEVGILICISQQPVANNVAISVNDQ